MKDIDFAYAPTMPAALMDSMVEQAIEQARAQATGTAAAQLIEYASGQHAALAPHASVELLDQARTVEVPGAAHHCHRLVQWRNAWLPLFDLRVLLAGCREPVTAPSRYTLVVAWQAHAGAPLSHGALALPSPPRAVRVSDSDGCELPRGSDWWPLLSLSCFKHAGAAVPVLDVAALFQLSPS